MSKNIPNKLLYILPEASKVTHMKYNVEFIKSLGQDCDISVIVEKGDSDLKDYVTNVVYINKNNKKQNKIFRVLSTLFYIVKFRVEGYKIVYVHYSFLSAILATLVIGNKIYYWNCGLPFKYKRSKLVMAYEFVAYHMIDYLVTGTEELGKMYANYYKFSSRKIRAIPNWINIEQFNSEFVKIDVANIFKELKIENTNRVLFFNQRLSERKGAHYIMKVMESMASDVIMIVTNDGPYKDTLFSQIKEKNMESRFRILGKVEHHKIIGILEITDLYILSSEEEGMSHSLLEAMAAGVATVAFDVGSTYEMYPDKFKNYVIKNLDIKEYTSKIKYLLSDEKERAEFGAEMKVWVKKYDKEIVKNEFLKKVINYKM